MYRIRKSTAIVTGVSHSHGIGASICRKLAKNGSDIVFTYWQSAENWSTTFSQEIQSYGVRCKSLEIDLSNKNSASLLTTVCKWQ
jgi:3-oxoacyl-[acyl-carrier protein] reductase